MADAMETLKGLLGDGAEDKIKDVMNSLSGGGNSFDQGSLDDIMQIKDIISRLSTSRNDPRSNLLMSLRPYMRSSRQSSIDNAVRLLNLSKLAALFR